MSPPIYTPDGSEVSEIVLPDGSTASEVIGPDGNVVFEAGPDIPDSVDLEYHGSSYTGGDTTWVDEINNNNMSLSGGESATTLSDGTEAVAFGGDPDGGSIPSFSTITGANLNQFTIEVPIQWSGTEIYDLLEARDGNGDFFLQLFFNVDVDFNQSAGDVFAVIEEPETTAQTRFATTGLSLNDGVRHNITVQYDGANGDISFIVDGSVANKQSSLTDVVDLSGVSWSVLDVANNSRTGRDFVGDVGAVRWHGGEIVGQTINGYP